ncbi:MAG: peptidylprolyl isomerase [Bacteroidales bacterium]|nr:peptidylprolyl isomerase [Bacteroidales bacterium]
MKYFIWITNIIFLLTIIPASAQDQDQEAVPQGTTVDEVVAVIGKNYILRSDVESQYLQMRMQGTIKGAAETVKCQLFENLMFEKLLLHQAVLDSVVVTPEQVNTEQERRMRYFIQQFGTQVKLEKYYNKTILEFKQELHDVIADQMMVGRVQENITANTNVTPSEVRRFFKEIPRDSIPLISSVVEVMQLVKKPPISYEEKFEVKERLKTLRERILNGESFEALAVLYSEDPGSAKQGGDIGLHSRGELYPEFEAVAFKLEPGEISEIVETEAGFHIIQGIEKRGEFSRVRHILIRPKVSPVALAEARMFLDSIAQLIRQDSLTFENAVRLYSTDPSKNNGGIMINPNTGSAQWSVEELDPKVFFVIDKLDPREVSTPVLMEDEKGEEAYRLLMLSKRTIPHRANLEEDYNQIQEWALQQKKQEAIVDWINKNARKTYIKVYGEFEQCKFAQKWF